ncbi:MAG: SPOR domain-containing protein [Gammaproteobacteria bacterium]
MEKNQLKHRLIGALVLVSLAVILIPLFLPDNEKEQGPAPIAAVPPAPSLPDQSSVAQAFPAPGDADGSAPGENTPAMDVTADTVVDSLIPAPSSTPPPAEPKPSITSIPASESSKSVEPKPAKPKTVAPKPAESKPVATPHPSPSPVNVPTAWVVQLGSFSSEQNALVLRDRLRAKGYTAFVERIAEGEGAAIRVRIGPELLRSNAEALQQKLEQEMKLKGIVMRYK